MILLNDFYHIKESARIKEDLYEYQIVFQIQHDIFKAHFPNQPIVPGACLSQISKELVEQIEHNPIHILQFHQLKFLNTINPEQFAEITVQIELKQEKPFSKAQIKFYHDSNTFAKLDYQYE